MALHRRADAGGGAGGPADATPDAVVGQPVNWGQVVNTLRHTHNLDAPVIVTSGTIDIPGGVQLPPRTFIPLIPK
ncbi:MAG TPA: hypothetical protein VNK95_17495 [Caldilineaceae bacterium]|nr:hypothetical protein [Caldilineaceae bacterium]